MTKLDSILKIRDIALPTKVCLVKAMVFPLVMCGCESCTVNKAEHRRIDAFELWCWRRLLRVPWTARKSNQSILKEISPGCSLEGLMLKLKLHYFGHLMWRTDSFEETLMLGKVVGRRRRGRRWDGWMASPTQWTWVWLNSVSWWWTGRPGVLQFMGSQRVGHGWVTELNWKVNVKVKYSTVYNNLPSTMLMCRGFPGGSVVRNPPANEVDTGSIPRSEASPGEGNGNPLQYPCLEKPMNRGSWQATVHSVEKSWTQIATK